MCTQKNRLIETFTYLETGCILQSDNQRFGAKNCDYFLIHHLKHVAGAHKKFFIEKVLLSTHNICFDREK